ncbi:MAG: DUF819 family protein [Bacteroidales bacterium]|nr:DUF819 family protein [Bacteroidales bacterium]
MKVLLFTLSYFVFPFIIILLFNRYKWAKTVGTVILAYAVGLIPALLGWTDFGTDEAAAATMGKVQTWIMNLAVPIAIPLMLFNCNFKLWTKSLPKTAAALGGGILAVLIAIISGFFLFRHAGIPDIANVAGMMTGIYTGGTMNFNALGVALHVEPSTITTVLTFEMLVTFPIIMFIVAGGYKLFRKLLPYRDESVTVDTDGGQDLEHGIEQYHGMLRWRTFLRSLVGLAISIGLLAIGAGLSLLLTGKLNELVIILTITTLSIAASFIKPIREIPKTFELGMFFILIFSIVVASQFDLWKINTSALATGAFLLFIVLVSSLLHLLFCRIFKVSGDLYGVGLVALLCSPPFVPPVVGAMGNKKVLISGIVIGLIGYAIGTYLGVALAWGLGFFI